MTEGDKERVLTLLERVENIEEKLARVERLLLSRYDEIYVLLLQVKKAIGKLR